MAQGFKAKAKPDPKKAVHTKAKPVTKGARTYAPNKKHTLADKNRTAGNSKVSTPQAVERLIVGKADGSGSLKILKEANESEVQKAKGKKAKKA